MPIARLLRLRSRARAGLLTGLVATILVTTATLVCMFGWLSLATEAQLRDALGTGEASTSVKVLQTRLPDGAAEQEAQQAEADALFAELFGDTVIVTRTVTPEPQVRVRWALTAQPEGLSAVRLAQLHDGFQRVGAAVGNSALAPRGAVFEGSLDDTVATAVRGVGAVNAIAPVPLLLAAALGWMALTQLARLLGAARASESELLRARGLSSWQSLVLALLEATGVTVVGVASGVAVAVGVLAAVSRSTGAGAALGAWPTAVLASVAALVTLTVTARRTASAETARSQVSLRAARIATLSTSVLVLLAAGVFIWQLQLHGAAGAANSIWERTITALAPTLAIAGGAIIALSLFRPLSSAIARLAARGRGIAPALPARQIARRAAASAVTLVLVTVAVGGAVLASAYAGTWTAIDTSANALETGADLRASVQGGAATPEDLAAAAQIAGITAAAPGDSAQVVLGDDVVSLVALPSVAVEQVVVDDAHVDRAALAEALAPGPDDIGAMVLPEGTSGLRFAIDVFAPQAVTDTSKMLLRAWVMDATGATFPARLTVTPPSDPEATVVTADTVLPPGTAPWSFIGVTADVPLSYEGSEPTLQLLGVEVVAGASTSVLTLDHAGSPIALQYPVRSATLWNVVNTAQAAPAVITAALAARLDIGIGDTLNPIYAGTGRTVNLVVREVVDVIPGAPAELAVLTSLEGLAVQSLVQNASIRGASEVWAAGDAAAADALAAAVGASSVRTAQGGAVSHITALLLTVWWVGVAAGLGLALVALSASIADQHRSRSAEVGLLRALGLARQRQAALRTGELFAVVGAGTVFGALVGVVAAVLVVPDLAVAAVPGAPVSAGTQLSFALAPLGIALGMLLLGVVVIALVQARRVAAQATFALPEGDAR